jgi:hypothetical protein
MNALLTAIVLWLSANFDLPASYDHPNIEFEPASRIAALRYKGLAVPPPDPGQREVVAIYDSSTKTIYLREGWIGDTPAELSVLVHEMVHHLQNLGAQKFECPQAREELAYRAQERWLGLLGRDLEHDFQIDPFTRLITTRCVH